MKTEKELLNDAAYVIDEFVRHWSAGEPMPTTKVDELFALYEDIRAGAGLPPLKDQVEHDGVQGFPDGK
jgi:hypothetical protein